MKRLRVGIAGTAVAALVVSLSVTAGAQTTTTAGGASSGSSRTTGVTDTTIKLGVPFVDFAKLRDVGVKIDRGDPEKIAAALAAGVNARGGVTGRRVEIVPVLYDILQPASVEASCVELAEDRTVFAVLQVYPTTSVTGNQCLADHQVIVLGQDINTETLARSSAKTPVFGAYPGVTRTMALYAKLLAKKGVFKGKTVGVVTDSAQSDATKKVLVPALRKQGVNPKFVIVDDVPAGDTAAEDANWAVYAEKIKAEGVDHLVLVGGQAAAGPQRLADNGLNVEVSSPSTDTVASLGRTQNKYPASTFDGTMTVMGLGDADRFKTPIEQQCVADFEKANPGITVKSPDQVAEGQTDWAVGIADMCNGLDLFTKIATKAGKNLNNASFFAAGTALTDNFALLTNPYNTFGPKKFDAGNGLRIAVFDSKLGKNGALKPQGPMVNLVNG